MGLTAACKNAEAQGQRSPNGFVVYKGSTAVAEERPSAQQWIKSLRQQLLDEGAIAPENGLFRFIKDAEFSSPSAAAATVRGGNANGLTAWRTQDGVTLRELDEAG